MNEWMDESDTCYDDDPEFSLYKVARLPMSLNDNRKVSEGECRLQQLLFYHPRLQPNETHMHGLLPRMLRNHYFK